MSIFNRILITSIILFALWLLLSGHFDFQLLSLGILSCLFIAWLSLRMGLLDKNSSTLSFNIKLPIFLPWFFLEVIKSNLDVCKQILQPKLTLDPTISSISIFKHNNIGKAVYANCITLTPGTYSIDIDHDFVEVHSLTKKSAEGLKKGEMGKRILALQTRSSDNINT